MSFALHARACTSELPQARLAMPRGALLALMAIAALAACRDETPPPTRVDAKAHPYVRPKAPERKRGPFRHPDRDAPESRSGEQLKGKELEEVIAQGTAALAAGDRNEAARVLRRCANKVEPNRLCEARLALALLPEPRRKAEARYYLFEGTAALDPALTPAELDQLANELRKRSMYEQGLAVAKEALKREESAERWKALSGILQAEPATLAEAADALASARKLDPKPRYALEEATVRAQLEDDETQLRMALDLFEEVRPLGGQQGLPHEGLLYERISTLRHRLGLEPAPPPGGASAPSGGADSGAPSPTSAPFPGAPGPQ